MPKEHIIPKDPLKELHEKDLYTALKEYLVIRRDYLQEKLIDKTNVLLSFAENAYAEQDKDKMLLFEESLKTIDSLVKESLEQDKTEFKYNEYLNARLGGMSHQEIKKDKEIREHYDFSGINKKKLIGFSAAYGKYI